MDKSYATPDLAKMAMYWGFDRPCSAGVTVKLPFCMPREKRLTVFPTGLSRFLLWSRFNVGSVRKKFEEYYDALAYGIAAQFGIWRSEKQ